MSVVAENIEHSAQDIEAAALRDIHDAADAPLRRRLGLRLHEIGDALVSVASEDPSILFNRTTGLGVSRPASRREVNEIAAVYRDAGITRYFVQHHPKARPAELAAWLTEAGLVPQRDWMKFHHDLASAPESDLAGGCESVDAAHADAFGAIVTEGFGLASGAAALLSRLVGRPGWHPLMVRVGTEPAGVGALFIHQGIGWCDWAATRPAYRGRGIQRGLLAARIQLARRMGCRALLATTGAAVPGDPQHSYQNILNAGFRELYLCRNMAPAR